METITQAQILSVTHPDRLQLLTTASFIDREPLSLTEFFHLAYVCNALFVRPDTTDACVPHVQLSSGDCSNAYFYSAPMLQYANLCDILGSELEKLISINWPGFNAAWTVGVPYGALGLAYTIALQRTTQVGFCEKQPNQSFAWQGPPAPCSFDEGILPVEDTISTGKNLGRLKEALWQQCNRARFDGIVALVNRGRSTQTTDGTLILSLVEWYDARIWSVPQSECVLCAQQSKSLKPKENWDHLMEYTDKTYHPL